MHLNECTVPKRVVVSPCSTRMSKRLFAVARLPPENFVLVYLYATASSAVIY